jgi:hypothetical protein
MNTNRKGLSLPDLHTSMGEGLIGHDTDSSTTHSGESNDDVGSVSRSHFEELIIIEYLRR